MPQSAKAWEEIKHGSAFVRAVNSLSLPTKPKVVYSPMSVAVVVYEPRFARISDSSLFDIANTIVHALNSSEVTEVAGVLTERVFADLSVIVTFDLRPHPSQFARAMSGYRPPRDGPLDP